MDAFATLVLVGARPRKAAVAALAGALAHDPRTRFFPVRVAAPGPELRESVREALTLGPTVVGWSLSSADLEESSSERARLARTEGALHVAGGPHPTADPEGTLRAGFALAALGEGEQILTGLLARVARGEDPRGPGLAWMEAGRLCTGSRPPPVDLDEVPPFAPALRRFGPIEISRGCAHACRFCQTTRLHGGRVRHRSPRVVAGWVREMARAGLPDVRFLSPSALGYGSEDGGVALAALEELLSRAREAQGAGGRLFLGSFPSEVRPEHVSPEALRLLRRFVANDRIVVGAQSGSDRVLRACGRGHGVEDVRRAVRLGLEAGFRVQVDLIFGLPGETEEDALATRRLMAELGGEGAGIHAHAFLPLPGTAWQGEPPGFLDAASRAELERLAGGGRAFGQWRRHEALGRALAFRHGSRPGEAEPIPDREGRALARSRGPS